MHSIMKSKLISILVFILASQFSTSLNAAGKSPYEEMAFELTALFRAYRATITLDKKRIHEPNTYFTKENIDQRIKEMHTEVKLKYKAMTNKDYPTDDYSFKGRTRTTLEKSFEKTLRDYVTGYVSLDWKGENKFVKKWDGKMLPARFASYAATNFNKISEGMILIKLTSSEQLLVNVNNKPEDWENKVIDQMIYQTKNNNVAFVEKQEKDQYRFLIPEYYGQGCIHCHGTKEGQLGNKIHPTNIERNIYDLAGAISIIFKY